MAKGTKFGNELRRLRIACGLTQQAVADALHVNRATYTYYETGKTTPSVERLGKIAEIFGVSELHLASLLQVSFETEPLDTQRAPKKSGRSPREYGPAHATGKIPDRPVPGGKPGAEGTGGSRSAPLKSELKRRKYPPALPRDIDSFLF